MFGIIVIIIIMCLAYSVNDTNKIMVAFVISEIIQLFEMFETVF